MTYGGHILGKPADAAEAARMLRDLRGRWHEVVTAVAVVAPSSQAEVAHTLTRALMRDYMDDEIEAYIASGKPLDKAGAYGIQDEDFHPVAEYDGCYCNAVGPASVDDRGATVSSWSANKAVYRGDAKSLSKLSAGPGIC